jgi:intraflagellar transport protein 80
MVTALSFTPTGSGVYSVCDDKTLTHWNSDGETEGDAVNLDCHVTDIAWFPPAGKSIVDLFAASCTDGSLRFFKKNGLLEKKIQAHEGAAISVSFNLDGSSLVTTGEDGEVKVWSRNGNLRSKLAEYGQPVYCVTWGPDNDSILIPNGSKLTIFKTQSRGKSIQWTAQANDKGVIMCADWNNVNNLIISGGEDCIYRVFDPFGLPLYVSSPHEHVITSISWRPNGTAFAVGSFNMIRLCDRTGWTYSRERPQVGSVLKSKWSSDGTQLAAACGSGTVFFAQLINRELESGGVQAKMIEPKKIQVNNLHSSNEFEELDFPRDRIVEMALGHNHLVVATTSQCFIYENNNWNTPQIFDLKNPVNLIVLSSKLFAVVDTVAGVVVYNYEGRVLSTPKFQGLRPEFLSEDTISISSDVVAILDRTDSLTIRCFDALTGRPLGGGMGEIKHDTEITKLALSQHGSTMQDRRLVFVDRNRELFITPVTILPGVKKEFSTQKM